MKIILGDNQFFGINHFDLKKGEKTKLKFDKTKEIEAFIKDSLKIGLDGFTINSNAKGYELLNICDFDVNTRASLLFVISTHSKELSETFL